MTAYYNEFDPSAAAWLRELIHSGVIAPGDVDERSITEVEPVDLIGYTQCHFFAGIGGWSYALRLTGWPDDRPVWTGSCPCQPFSAAGKRQGKQDERHLWPEFYRLIRECKPSTVFGEQVAAAIGLDWLDHVSDDLEASDYAVGAIVLPACSVGAPHIRQRLWFVADTGCERRQQDAGSTPGDEATHGRRAKGDNEPSSNGKDLRLADTNGRQSWNGELQPGGEHRLLAEGGGSGELVQPCIEGLEGHAGHGDDSGQPGRVGSQSGGSVAEAGAPCPFCGYVFDQRSTGRYGCPNCNGEGLDAFAGATRGFWHPADWIPCRDGKARPVEPGTFPLAHGVPARVGRLRGYGNAIVPEAAAEFIKAYLG